MKPNFECGRMTEAAVRIDAAATSASKARGFTLLELLVVVSIAIVVSAVALPVFLTYSRPNRLRNDANALASLVTMARMRASSEFSHVQVICTPTPTSGPPYCQLQSKPYNVNGASWNNDNQMVYLSAGVSFGIPPSTAVSAYPPGQSSGAYQGNAEQYTPIAASNTTTPVIMFNSRGLPIDAALNMKSDYAFYLKDQAGNYIAVAVNLTGRPDVYVFGNDATACPKPALPCFSVLREY